MSKKVYLFLLASTLCASFAAAQGIDADFDGRGGAGNKMEIADLKIVEPGELSFVPSKGTANNALSYYLWRDSSDKQYAYQSQAESDGKLIVDRLRSAGYIILSAYPQKDSNGWFGYAIEFSAPGTNVPGSVQTYSLWRDSADKQYGYQYQAENDGKILADKLRSAGYIIVFAKAQQDYNKWWGYYIEYIAPSGKMPDKVQTYSLWRDSADKQYGYQYQAENDGKIAADRLRSAGYIVILAKAQQDYNKWWGYYIEYLAPAGNFADKQQTYSLWRDSADKQYGYQYQAENDGKILADKLRSAGYVIVFAKAQQDYNKWWGYYVEYIAPAGKAASAVQSFDLWRGQNNAQYGYQYQAENDGKIIADNFRATGYIVLFTKVQQDYNKWWGYHIEYITSIK